MSKGARTCTLLLRLAEERLFRALLSSLYPPTCIHMCMCMYTTANWVVDVHGTAVRGSRSTYYVVHGTAMVPLNQHTVVRAQSGVPVAMAAAPQ